jgi:predicted nucleic acid-binding protein
VKLLFLTRLCWLTTCATPRPQPRIRSLTGLIRTSSAVLAALWRGATKPAELKFLHAREKNHPILTPTEANWLESGQLWSKLHLATGFTPEKLGSLHFDALITLTARSHGACLITTKRAVFELIDRYRKFDLEVW